MATTSIDLGLFEPGPLDLGTTTFRGYSGGARSEIILTHAEATPGYRVGTLPHGRWHALLGLYRVATSGVDVTVTIETATRDVIRHRGLCTVAIAPAAVSIGMVYRRTAHPYAAQ